MAKKRSKALSVSVGDQLRTLLSLKVKDRSEYRSKGRKRVLVQETPYITQAELARELGISERTLRRVKADPSYQVSARTAAKIAAPLRREYNAFKRHQKRGIAYVRGQVIYDKRYALPDMPISAIPDIRQSKNGEWETIEVNCESWPVSQKISYLTGAILSGRFYAYYMRVKTPHGTVYRDGEIVTSEPGELDEDNHVNRFFMVGPEAIRAHKRVILGGKLKRGQRSQWAGEDMNRATSEIEKYSDGGMVIVAILLTEQK